MSHVLLVQAESRQIPLADKSVHMVCTSPPYYAVRDYGTATWEGGEAGCDHLRTVPNLPKDPTSTLRGRASNQNHEREGYKQQCGKCGATRMDDQLGLEALHDCLGWATGQNCGCCYICHMREVFREVWRVLRDDGVMFVNISDSYFSGNGKARSSRRRKNLGEPSYDTSDTAPVDYQDDGRSLNDLCDGCQAALSRHTSHSDSQPAHESIVCEGDPTQDHTALHCSSLDSLGSVHPLLNEQSCHAKPDLRPVQGHAGEQLPFAQESTNPAFFAASQEHVCSHCANCGGCLLVLHSASRDARLCGRKKVSLSSSDLTPADVQRYSVARDNSHDTAVTDDASAFHNVGMVSDSYSYLHYTKDKHHIPLKPKSLIGIPQRLALALQADGWIFRSDIIWNKLNCMPESVQDRPTRSHEYVLLFSKKAKYYYDAEAIREEAQDWGTRDRTHGKYHTNGFRSAGQPPQHGLTDGNFATTGRNSRSVWSIPSEPLPPGTGHFACVDDQTECLTQGGWKRWDTLTPTDLIAQWDIHTQRASWGPLLGIATYDVTDLQMVRIKSTQQDQLLTPDHRCVVHYGRWPKSLKVVTANELVPDHRMIVATEWEPNSSKAALSLEWAELLGWYVAEGYVKNHIRVEIYQSEYHNPLFCARIEYLLQAVEALYEKVVVPRVYRGITRNEAIFVVKGFAAAKLQSLAPGKGKKLPWDVMQWPMQSLRGLLDGLVGGDGHTRGDGRNNFVQRSKDTIDLVQAIAFRLGLCSTISSHADRCYVVNFTSSRQTRSLRGTNGKTPIIGTEIYTGVVWCPTTPLGTWIARRNGKVFITGNSFPTALASRMILAGSSAHGVCSACRAPWRRVVEKPEGYPSGSFHNHAQDGVAYGRRQNGKGPLSGAELRKLGPTTTTGWQPSCSHYCACASVPVEDAFVCPHCEKLLPWRVGNRESAVILDPFCGSGATLLAARALGRHSVGLDLSWSYLHTIARKRLYLVPTTHAVTYTDLPLFALEETQS